MKPIHFHILSPKCTQKARKFVKVVILVDELRTIHAVSNKQFEASPPPPPSPLLIHRLPYRRNIRLKVVTVSWNTSRKSSHLDARTFVITSLFSIPVPCVWGRGIGNHFHSQALLFDNTLEISSNKFTKVQLNAHTIFSVYLIMMMFFEFWCSAGSSTDMSESIYPSLSFSGPVQPRPGDGGAMWPTHSLPHKLVAASFEAIFQTISDQIVIFCPSYLSLSDRVCFCLTMVIIIGCWTGLPGMSRGCLSASRVESSDF